MNKSEQINDLVTALSKVQGEMESAKKDATNPFYKSKYADLHSTWEACRGPLTKNGLCVIQTTTFTPDIGLLLITTLAHTSGQWISAELPVRPTKDDPQGLGSCISYMRRYALQAIVGITTEDDDAEAATNRTSSQTYQRPLPPRPAVPTGTSIKPAIKLG